VGVGGVEC